MVARAKPQSSGKKQKEKETFRAHTQKSTKKKDDRHGGGNFLLFLIKVLVNH